MCACVYIYIHTLLNEVVCLESVKVDFFYKRSKNPSGQTLQVLLKYKLDTRFKLFCSKFGAMQDTMFAY